MAVNLAVKFDEAGGVKTEMNIDVPPPTPSEHNQHHCVDLAKLLPIFLVADLSKLLRIFLVASYMTVLISRQTFAESRHWCVRLQYGQDMVLLFLFMLLFLLWLL